MKSNNPVKVLILETSMRVGGTETVLSRLMRGLDRKKIDPVLCCIYDAGSLGQELIDEGMNVQCGLAKGRWDLLFPFRLYQLLKREKVEVLFIVNQPVLQFWGTICGVFAGVKGRITAIRSTGKINRIQRRLFINNITFPWITCVTALSNMHKKYLIEAEGIDEKKIKIITNGVDLKRFDGSEPNQELRKSLNIPDSAQLVGIVAMLRPEKAHHVFVRAAGEVLKEVPEARFLIIGEGPERPGLEAQAKELGIQDKVLFLGSQGNVAEWVNLFDVAVLSSDPVVETVSNSVLEYMSVRKPVVSTSVGSLPEMVDEGLTGYLIEPRDWKSMADRIVSLLKDRDLAIKMGAAGREKIERYFSMEQMIKNWENLFQQLAEKKEASL